MRSTIPLRVFRSEGVGLATCTEPKLSVAVPSGLTDEQEAAAFLKLFYDRNLDNNCGALILGYHGPGEYGALYTEGRVDLRVNGNSHVLTVDIGAPNSGKQYRVTY